jgi:hypothetical protein
MRTPTTPDAPITVIFRTYPDGDVIALAPDTIANASGHCVSYQHIGQHSAADYRHVLATTRPATEPEIAPLLAELTAIGYAVTTRRRAPAWRSR